MNAGNATFVENPSGWGATIASYWRTSLHAEGMAQLAQAARGSQARLSPKPLFQISQHGSAGLSDR
jgi:hypothetical protein